MTIPAASVIVVSRHRAAALGRCLMALAQQDHPQIEVIVVADPEGLAAAKATGLALKRVLFDEANISAARNLGLAAAAAPVVAFIDDDAVAEPTWISRLCAAFADPQVVAATGFVRGRNGISYQWKACEVDAFGFDHPLPDHAASYPGTPPRAPDGVHRRRNLASKWRSIRVVHPARPSPSVHPVSGPHCRGNRPHRGLSPG